jgi:hypothetical protein
MTGIQEFKIANCFVAKLVNIPDINCVSRLAFDDFNSHGCSPRLIQRFLKITSDNAIHAAFCGLKLTCFIAPAFGQYVNQPDGLHCDSLFLWIR